MAVPHVTYCGNVHPATDVPAWVAMVRDYAVPVATAQRQAGHGFGLGTWWNADTAHSLAVDISAFETVRGLLAKHDLRIWTVNVFPHGGFHGQPVKEQVYQPDWTSEERVLYVRHVAEVVARLGTDLPLVSLSTLPLGYRPDRRFPEGDPEEWRLMARNLVRVASHLHAMEAQWGVRMMLALEPEPFCLLESVADAMAFLEQWVFREGAWETVHEATLRRHLGVCVDLCHLAVVREEPLAALAALRSRGIEAAKIQVSSCLEVRDPQQQPAFDRLLACDEPVYLHQTIAEDGRRALDLSAVRAARADFQGSRLRTHFHVPVFWDQEGAFGSTRAEIVRVLGALVPPLPLLEVETYTWGVLGGVDGGGLGGIGPEPGQDLVTGLLQELAFVHEHRKP
ncbi:MAG: metabolite traffic protein EboE [Planctomycetota bacterium]